MTFGNKALAFYMNLEPPDISLPEGIEVLNPLNNRMTRDILEDFYNRYYHDRQKRIFLIGINPGRFGGGITGIPFTDPVNLDQVLHIQNDFEKKHELSSRFVYEVIERTGGPESFFGKFYLTAVSPLGFIKDHKNLNYYDVSTIKDGWEDWFVSKLKEQIAFGADQEVAFSMGQGKNLDFLDKINEVHQLFRKIKPLPHPRWVMQYRFKKRQDYIKEYVAKIHS